MEPMSLDDWMNPKMTEEDWKSQKQKIMGAGSTIGDQQHVELQRWQKNQNDLLNRSHCPNCGTCPTCGRSPYTFPNYPVYPNYPSYPGIGYPWTISY